MSERDKQLHQYFAETFGERGAEILMEKLRMRRESLAKQPTSNPDERE